MNRPWPQPWLYHLEAEILDARSAAEAAAAWHGYALELEQLETANWEDYNDAWLRLHRLARLMFLPQIKPSR